MAEAGHGVSTFRNAVNTALRAPVGSTETSCFRAPQSGDTYTLPRTPSKALKL